MTATIPEGGTSERAPALDDSFFYPRSVAVVGVSSSGQGMGGGYLTALKEMGFPEDRIYAVNPKATEIQGFPCYPSLADIPGPVDYMISSVPADRVLELMDQVVQKGVRAVHFFTAGFSETGDADRADLERQVLERARAGDVRVLGPNCMGLYVPSAGLAFMPGFPRKPGHVGMISQSGANAGEFVRTAGAAGVRFSKVISYGNAAQLNEADFFEYIAGDEDTKYVAAYIEGVRDGRRFLRALARTSARKPVFVLKGGRTEAGSRAAHSHTGSLAGSLRVFDSICRQLGVLRVESMEDLVDLAAGFQFVGPPPGRGVAIVGAGGGASVLAADDAASAGLTVPTLPEPVQAGLREFTPVAGTSIRNPVDTNVLDSVRNFVETIRLVSSAEEIQTIIFHTSFSFRPPGRDGSVEDRVNRTMEGLLKAREVAGDTPIVLVPRTPVTLDAMEATDLFVKEATKEGFATFPSINRAARALARMLEWREMAPNREVGAPIAQ